jgi:exopolysaccharide biosynthesis polyprenyl glycosylphosphotransferase
MSDAVAQGPSAAARAEPGNHLQLVPPLSRATRPKRLRGHRGLRLRLIGLDVLTIAVTWLAALTIHGIIHGHGLWPDVLHMVPTVVVLTIVTFVFLWSQRLYQSRVCAVRSLEVNRIFRVAVAVAVLASAWHKFVTVGPVTPAVAVVGAGCVFATLAAERAMFTGWLRLRRARGEYLRPVCVIGSNDEAEALVYLLNDHPELGYTVAAVVGDEEEWGARIPEVRFLPGGREPAAAVIESHVTGVLIATTALSATGRDQLLNRLMAEGIHIHMSCGMTRFGRQRIRLMPLAHHSALYVEPPLLSVWQPIAKRGLDLVVAMVGLFLAIPLLIVAAVAIKAEDGGAVIFRQERVGLNGRVFKLLKLRTMVPNAAEMVVDLADRNERHGPLFKLTADPRVTRIGQFLRTSSIDEIPQLVNVLKGEMSVVGPRPALPSEFAQFDSDLAGRTLVRPGITGLWQVEARDNPSFRTYRRLDLFYVENWSIGFDLAIMAGTARMLANRTVGALRHAIPPHLYEHHKLDDPAEAVAQAQKARG